jgi:PEGA domain
MLVPALVAVFVVAWPAIGDAQYRGHHGGRVVYAAPYYPYYPFAFGFGWGPWYPYPYYGYPYYSVDPGGSLKLEVKPPLAEVYVDGYYAGIVDDFDGTFQRLHTTPGEHEISLFLDGYKAIHQKLYVQPNVTTKVKYEMAKLAAGEQPEARPQPVEPPQQNYAPGPNPYQPPQGPQGPQGPPSTRRPPPQPRDPRNTVDPGELRPADLNTYGTLSVRVQPGGADIIVDNERWDGPAGQERIFIELPEGRHQVEIRKSGYRTYITEIEVRRGETASLNVSLRNQENE